MRHGWKPGEGPGSFNVYYRNKNTNRLCRYCVMGMDYTTAEKYRDNFNERYPNKAYPNGKGHYPFSEAWVDKH